MKNIHTKFEGTEKKIDVILSSPKSHLRDNQDGKWDVVVSASRARIISQISTQYLDAYLLSESSLFVWEDRILMITCGKTRLIDAFPEILKITGTDSVSHIFYERKNLQFPKEQPSNFENEAAVLENFFQGRYYRLGSIDHDHVHLFHTSPGPVNDNGDATLHIQMHDLSKPVIALFNASSKNTTILSQMVSCFKQFMPGMITDHYFFSPLGFSLNAILNDKYLTVHVTPQSEGSYASLETNLIASAYSDLIESVLSIFKPGKFSIVLTTNRSHDPLPVSFFPQNSPNKYGTADKSAYDLDCGYTTTFSNYIN